jgi:N12 class adenine-specific DNA methylase
VQVPGRALIQALGTPITNTLGEMYTLLRFQAPEALRERGVHEFDAWASAFGDTGSVSLCAIGWIGQAVLS